MRVPQELQKIIGKRELKKWLKTSDIRMAERLSAIYAFQIYATDYMVLAFPLRVA